MTDYIYHHPYDMAEPTFSINHKSNISRLFPHIGDKQLGTKLKIDEESKSYISVPPAAEQITNIIQSHLKDIDITPQYAVITDATAGVGGDAISFCNRFSYVHAIEIDDKRCKYLENNIKSVYKLKNVCIYNRNCLEIISTIPNHDVVFIDPPWGGKNYKDHDKLRLTLSDQPLESICNHLFNPLKMRKTPQIIVLKLPKNYDIKYLYDVVSNTQIYLYELHKMLILVLVSTST